MNFFFHECIQQVNPLQSVLIFVCIVSLVIVCIESVTLFLIVVQTVQNETQEKNRG